MATISRSRRATSGIAFIVAGALFVLAAVLPLVNVSLPWLYALAYVATAVGFVILGLGAVNNTVAKIALFAGALGWAILAIATLGVALPGGLITFGSVIAAVGGLVGAIVLYVGKEITNTAALAFIVATVLAALLLLHAIAVFSLGSFLVVVVILVGAAFIVTGIYFRRTERRR